MNFARPQHEGWLWGVTFAIWLAGSWPIYMLWYAKPFGNGAADSFYVFAIYLFAFVYFLALAPLRGIVGHVWERMRDWRLEDDR